MNNKFLQEAEKLRIKSKLGLFKNLPTMFFFTDRKKVDNVFEVVKKLPDNTAIIIREYDLKDDDRLNFAKQIAVLARLKNLKVLVGKNWELAKKIGADGVHFSDFDHNFDIPKNRQNMLFSYSCHKLESLKEAARIEVDMVFYSPIFTSKSHPDKNQVGIYKLKNFVKNSPLPVYALGGINEENINLLTETGVVGVGGISMFCGVCNLN